MRDFIIREDVTVTGKSGPRDHTHYYKGVFSVAGLVANEWTSKREEAKRYPTRGAARKAVAGYLGGFRSRPRLTIETIEEEG